MKIRIFRRVSEFCNRQAGRKRYHLRSFISLYKSIYYRIVMNYRQLKRKSFPISRKQTNKTSAIFKIHNHPLSVCSVLCNTYSTPSWLNSLISTSISLGFWKSCLRPLVWFPGFFKQCHQQALSQIPNHLAQPFSVGF